jgi:L-alanine-DL-glutamate epimerase-like enolase superfamily enzyme
MRVGRPNFADDLAAIRAVHKRLPNDVALMVDFNQVAARAIALSGTRIPAIKSVIGTLLQILSY